MPRVLALDPGDRVGWARADISEDGHWNDFRHGITPLWEMADAVHFAIGEYDVIVMEDWRLYASHAKVMIGSSIPSIQFIGAVKAACRWEQAATNRSPRLILQGARIKDDADLLLKAHRPELYEMVTRSVSHKDGHDQDAIRHLFYAQWKGSFDV